MIGRRRRGQEREGKERERKKKKEKKGRGFQPKRKENPKQGIFNLRCIKFAC